MKFYYTEKVKSIIENDLGSIASNFNKFVQDELINKLSFYKTVDNDIKLFKARLNHSDRIVCTFIKVQDELSIMILEIILNHDYQKSEYSTPDTITIEKLQSELEYVKTQIGEQQKALLHSEEAKKKDLTDSTKQHIIGLEYARKIKYMDKFIQFDDQQEFIVDCKLPLVLNGSAGSGKTSVAIEKLVNIRDDLAKSGDVSEKNILYVTLSRPLVAASKKLFESHSRITEIATDLENNAATENIDVAEIAKVNVNFCSLDEFLKQQENNIIGDRQPITREIFLEWFESQSKTKVFKQYKAKANQLFEEFVAVIAEGNLAREEYVKLGQRQSIFADNERSGTYDIYCKYREYILNSREFYDNKDVLNHINNNTLQKKITYDAIVVDEVQDFTPAILKYILQQLDTNSQGQFLLCGDTNQIIHPTFFSISGLEKFLISMITDAQASEAIGEITYCTLTDNYRNSENTTRVANNILRFKNQFYGTEEKISETMAKSFFTVSKTKVKGEVSLVGAEHLLQYDKEITNSVEWAIVVSNNAQKQQVQAKFTSLFIFTVEEIKGLEFKNIILFTAPELYSTLFDHTARHVLEDSIVIHDQLIGENWNPHTTRSKDKEDRSYKSHEYHLNALYVAVSRTIENLYIITENSGQVTAKRQVQDVSKKFWTILTGFGQTDDKKSIDITAATIDEYIDKATELLKTTNMGNIHKVQAILDKVIETSNAQAKNGEILCFDNSKLLSLRVLTKSVAQRVEHRTNKHIFDKFEQNITKLHNIQAEYIRKTAQEQERAEGKQEIDQEIDVVKIEQTARVEGKQEIDVEKVKKTVNKKKTSHKTLKASKQTKEITFKEAMKLVKTIGSDTENLKKITTEQLELQCIEEIGQGRNLLAIIMPALVNIYKNEGIAQKKQGFSTQLQCFIRKISAKALHATDKSSTPKSVLDYLLGFHSNKTANSPTNLEIISKYIFTDDTCSEHLLSIIERGNWFKLNAYNAPIIAYFLGNKKTAQKLGKEITNSVEKHIYSCLKTRDAERPFLDSSLALFIEKDTLTDEDIQAIEFVIAKKANVNLFSNSRITALYSAARYGHIKVVDLLLRAGADMEARMSDGSTPLHIASLYKYTKIVELLLKAGADMEARMSDKCRALYLASEYGNTDIVEMLVKAGADKNAKNIDGYTALQIASKKEHVDIVKILLKAGVDKDSVNDNGWTALHIASLRGLTNVARILLEAGADMEAKNANEYTALQIASKKEHADIVKILVEAGADKEATDSNGCTALHIVSSSGHVDIVKILVKAGVNKDSRNINGCTALQMASEAGHADIVEILLKAGADMEAKDSNECTVIHTASQAGHVEVVEILLKAGADKNATNNGWTALHIASVKGLTNVARVLLEAGANKDSVNNAGWTVLHTASQAGHVEVVEVLLKAGADMKAKDSSGWTALHIASEKGHVDIVEMLVKAGADKNATDSAGWTALQIALSGRHVEVVRILLNNDDIVNLLGFAIKNDSSIIVETLIKAGVDKNFTVFNEFTLLHTAAHCGHEDIVDVLIKAGADLEIKSNDGSTALHMAVKGNHTKVIKKLIEAGANPNAATINGDTPLDVAIKKGNLDIKKIIEDACLQNTENFSQQYQDDCFESSYVIKLAYHSSKLATHPVNTEANNVEIIGGDSISELH